MDHLIFGMMYISGHFIPKYKDLRMYSLNKLCPKQSFRVLCGTRTQVIELGPRDRSILWSVLVCPGLSWSVLVCSICILIESKGWQIALSRD